MGNSHTPLPCSGLKTVETKKKKMLYFLYGTFLHICFQFSGYINVYNFFGPLDLEINLYFKNNAAWVVFEKPELQYLFKQNQVLGRGLETISLDRENSQYRNFLFVCQLIVQCDSSKLSSNWQYLGLSYTASNTLKPRYNDTCSNKIPTIKKLFSSPSVVNLIVKSPCNNKTPAIKNTIFCPFRFVKPRFQCGWIHNQEDPKSHIY
jgi:hypothetical protein